MAGEAAVCRPQGTHSRLQHVSAKGERFERCCLPEETGQSADQRRSHPQGYEITIADVEEEEDDKVGCCIVCPFCNLRCRAQRVKVAAYVVQPKQPVEFDQAINYVNKIKVRRARAILF